ncbi:MAG: hypothetical protein NT046_02715 [Arenimonas sp.]|nr:hypothetical protein [Arenimonas sp.]
MHRIAICTCVSIVLMLTACSPEESNNPAVSTGAQPVATATAVPATATPVTGKYSAEMADLAATLERKGIAGKEAEYIMAGYAASLEPPEPTVHLSPTFDAPPTQAELAEAAGLDNSFFDTRSPRPAYQPAETIDLATASPLSLFERVKDACLRQSQTELFATFSYSFRWAFSRMPNSDRIRMFDGYCRELSDPDLEDYFQGKRFFIMKSRSTENGVHKSILCSVPSGSPDSDCHGGMDVVVEDGVLQRDEF